MVHEPRTTDSPALLPARAQELIHGVPVGVMLVDRTHRLCYANRWVCDATGIPAEALAGTPLEALLIAADRDSAALALASVLSEGASRTWDAHLQHQPEGLVTLSAHPLYEGETVAAAQVVCLDSTARQQALARAARSERALDRLRQEMAASYSIGVGCTLTRDVAEVLRLIYVHTSKLFSCSTFAILLYDAAAREVSSALMVRDGQQVPPRRWSLDEDHSLIGRALRDPRPLLIRNWAQETGELPEQAAPVIQPDTQSWLSVPLIGQDRLLGMICLQHRERDAFSEADQRSLYGIADQATMVIENAQLYEMVNAQLAEASTLYMLSEQISYSLDTETVLNSVTDILKRVLNCRGCVIFLLDEEREWLEIQVSSGIKPHWQRSARMRMGEGIAGRVAQTGQPIYIPDTQCEPQFIVFDPAVRSLLAVPMVYKGSVIGVLNVDDDKVDAFTPDTERLLSIAAAQAAVAIENAGLFEALNERAARLARAHRELQESDRLRAEFVQNMSHELRTPLTFVKGYAELLLEGKLGPLTHRQQESVQIVSERTDQVIRLIDEMLTLQQVARGDLELGEVSLVDIARTQVRSARAIAQQEGLSLVEEYAPHVSLVLGDRDRLDRVFANLIGNALKFTPDGGEITVRVRNDGAFVRADVVDQGIGIEADHLARIFDRFYQVDGSSKRRFRGTGLGLAIVKEIVEAHGGEITVSSIPGSGTTFSFTVPAVRTPEAAQTPSAVRTPEAAQMPPDRIDLEPQDVLSFDNGVRKDRS
ncbi:MAG: GAF domain-containing protein [Anaerolineae bacterium]|nr:GAF domain-containing protein [Anaerolineae bacterium]